MTRPYLSQQAYLDSSVPHGPGDLAVLRIHGQDQSEGETH